MYVEVAFPIPARRLFTYRLPPTSDYSLKPGCRLYAPFGKSNRLGYAVNLIEEPPAGLKEIKTVTRVLDQEPLFGEELLSFLNWVADYYLASLGDTYSTAFPFSPSVRPKMIKVVILDEQIREEGRVPDDIKKPNQRRVIEFLINRKALLSPSDIIREVGVSSTTIKTLEQHGRIRLHTRESLRTIPLHEPDSSVTELTLTDEQAQALEKIEGSVEKKGSKPILMRGVTGSGKTEVYLRAIEKTRSLGRTALVLIPEIALTPQTLERFQSRFGQDVGLLHSGLGQGERYDEWRMIKNGSRGIVLGTRSSIFAPVENLGLIIVDEEHEASYKQSDPSPRYNARDLAVVRAQMSSALCLLGSATPSIESSHNVSQKKYDAVYLHRRIAEHGMPKVYLLDMRGRSEEEEVLSNEMKEALLERYHENRQSILFLNRRGFATTLSCSQCGHVLNCEHCSVAMVYHRSRNQLICHHCDYRRPLPQNCPSCSEKFIRQRGFGTERVVHELQALDENIRVVRMDRDTTRRKGDHDRLMTPFRRGEADVLVGTQMIAKGLDFPNVTLVGIINADYALSLPDFRAAERTFTLLTQVAGRSGRGSHPGEVYVQSYYPDHYSIQLALKQNYTTFFNKEIRYRRLIGFPPFSRLVLWRIEAFKEDLARDKAWELYNLLNEGLKHPRDMVLLPPVEAPLYRLRDYYRWQVALKSRDHKIFRPLLNSQEFQNLLLQKRHGLRIVQDVDPWDML